MEMSALQSVYPPPQLQDPNYPMQTVITRLLTSIFLLLTAVVGQGRAGEIDLESRDRPKLLDRTCEGLNHAYKRMRERSLYRETIFELKADGTLREHMTIIVHGPYVYQKLATEVTWDRLGNDAPYWQRFTSCTVKNVRGAGLYYATYHQSGRVLAAEVWTTTAGGTLTKFVRRYPIGEWFFPFATAVSVIDYRQKSIKIPETYTCGGYSCG